MENENQVPHNATQALAQRAVLAGVTVRLWTAEVLDRAVTAQTNSAHGAAADAGKYRKSLVPKETLEPIKLAAGRIRNLVASMTLPWTDDGLGVLPVRSVDSFNSKLMPEIDDFNEAVKDFIHAYPTLKDEATVRLGAMFNAADYPNVTDLARRFGVTPRILPIPTADDFRCQMSAEATLAAKRALDASNASALKGATIAAWNQAKKAIVFMAEKLAAYSPERDGEKARGIFRDTLVTNVIEMANRLPDLNLADDPRMLQLAEKMESELCYYSADDLRNDDAARLNVQKQAERIVVMIDQTIAEM